MAFCNLPASSLLYKTIFRSQQLSQISQYQIDDYLMLFFSLLFSLFYFSCNNPPPSDLSVQLIRNIAFKSGKSLSNPEFF